MIWTKANIITFGRLFLLFIFMIFLVSGIEPLMIAAIVICPIIFFMDYLDGWFARKYNEESLFGSMFDVIGDRLVETMMWLLFLSLGMVPLWAPVVMITRGVVTDTIRQQAQKEKKTVYGMLEQRFSKIFVSSRTSRGISGLSKILLFTTLAWILTFNVQGLNMLIDELVIFVVAFNILRGIPVFLEGWRYLKGS